MHSGEKGKQLGRPKIVAQLPPGEAYESDTPLRSQGGDNKIESKEV